MEQLIIDTLEQYFTSGEYQYCEPNISPTEYRTILADLKKLEQIEQIVAKWNNDASNSFSDMCKINGILKE